MYQYVPNSRVCLHMNRQINAWHRAYKLISCRLYHYRMDPASQEWKYNMKFLLRIRKYCNQIGSQRPGKIKSKISASHVFLYCGRLERAFNEIRWHTRIIVALFECIVSSLFSHSHSNASLVERHVVVWWRWEDVF